ncbi:hypothetical protein N9D38_07530 [Rubripirellula sp.]|jgi:cell division protein FtsX|nr:hypothetical protein [Rubripirellula sp.]
MAAYDDLDVKRIFVVGIASVVVTAVTALAVQVVYYTMAQQQKTETAAASNYARQNAILQAQQDEISAYGVDELTGKLVIPVDKAIEMLSQEDAAADSST